MIDLYDEEIIRIRTALYSVYNRYKDREPTVQTYLEMDDEINQRLYDAGFVCEVDFAPLANGEPPMVTILDRVDPISGFDHEKKQYEVQKIRDEGNDIEEIEIAGPEIDPLGVSND